MKILIFGLACVYFTWSGLWLVILGVTSDNPLSQGLCSFLAALSFLLAVACIGAGISKKDNGRLD